MENSIASISYFKPAAESATRYAGAGAIATLLQPSNTDVPTPPGKQIDLEKLALSVRLLLEALGENPDREGLLDTPARVARMYQELVYGQGFDPASEITCTFQEQTDEMVLVKGIPFTSMCEHHLLPFLGTASIAYIPAAGTITGLSKLARVVELASKRLQVQERMTAQIADALTEKLSCAGVLVFLEAEHMCMSIRGIKKAGSKTITTAARGELKSNSVLRSELMNLLARP